MARLEITFVKNLVLKTLVVGAVFSLGLGVFMGWWMALSTAFGGLVAAANLKVVEFVTRRMMEAAENGHAQSTFWSIILVLKMLVLFGTIFYLIVRLELDAIGVVVGFSAFLPAIVWQVLVSKDESSTQD